MKQCETFIESAGDLLENGDAEDPDVVELVTRATSLCGDMVSAQQDIQRILGILQQNTVHQEKTHILESRSSKKRRKETLVLVYGNDRRLRIRVKN